MNELHLSPEAQADLSDIKAYIAEDLGNPQAALATVAKITNAIRTLREYGRVGTPLSAVSGVRSDYRYLVSGSYMIFYRVADRDVFVDRILYGRRNYLRVLFEDGPGSEAAE